VKSIYLKCITIKERKERSRREVLKFGKIRIDISKNVRK
jgi:hypothetical protein